jgi:hypothetical protein
MQGKRLFLLCLSSRVSIHVDCCCIKGGQLWKDLELVATDGVLSGRPGAGRGAVLTSWPPTRDSHPPGDTPKLT